MCTLVRRRRIDAFELKVGIAMIGSCVFTGTHSDSSHPKLKPHQTSHPKPPHSCDFSEQVRAPTQKDFGIAGCSTETPNFYVYLPIL